MSTLVELPSMRPIPLFRETARCAEVDPELFYPQRGGSPRPAKRICAACECIGRCREWALEHGEQYGVWGGLSAIERRRVVRRRKTEAAAVSSIDSAPNAESQSSRCTAA